MRTASLALSRLQRGRPGGKADEPADIGNTGRDDTAAGRGLAAAERICLRRRRPTDHPLTGR